MTLASDIADDWQFIDGVEEVSLTPKNPAAAAVSNIKALRRVQTAKEFALVGDALGLEPSDVVWHLWTSTLSGVEPKSGDCLTDGSAIVWTIKSTAKTTLGTRWRLLCRRQVST